MKVAIVGIGLIGGSMALDLKSAMDNVKIVGIDKNEQNLKKAKELQLIDEVATLKDLKTVQVVIISVPVDVSIKVLAQVLDHIGENTLVLDTGSTKEKICESVKNHSKRRNYLAAHPIAGTEFSGPEAAIAQLYQNKTMIVCEVEKTAFKLQEIAFDIFQRLGMRIRYMDPHSHDKHIAYVSHLSHISAFMLGKTVLDKEKNEKDIFDLAGSGFASTVRLAKSSPAMWSPIFKQNKENVLETLTEYIQNLNEFKNLMEQDDFEKLFEEMKNTNHIKKVLNGIN
ncbi:prephenate dehydrogenase [Mesonia aestuariivivens]|uniref:Prephenate dehydrogenase n=1 Tax=Mesonia aestuariivivens TaxID=2796128 RepID=A0ABS6W459_9FLAO|nr:prephenate dehydrogenase [Mesonia aestuariivivens]MBW2962662.1 prephenate dehydrogenase [Mesonia aestuariivivens]